MIIKKADTARPVMPTLSIYDNEFTVELSDGEVSQTILRMRSDGTIKMASLAGTHYVTRWGLKLDSRNRVVVE